MQMHDTKQLREMVTSDPGCQAHALYDPRSYNGYKGQIEKVNLSKVICQGGIKHNIRQ